MSTAIQKVSYETQGQKIELSAATVKQYLVNGGGTVSDQEVMMFLKICEGQKLNPFLREAYLVKYGNQPASIIVGKDTFTKRAENSPSYKGIKNGIIVVNLNKAIEYREGTFYLKDREELVGGWARVLFKDGKEDLFNTVSLDEYIGKKKDGTINSMWQSKPATMIKKVATMQALRDAFPSTLGQMYTQEEIDIPEELPTDEINLQEERMKEREVPETPLPASKITKQQVMQLAAEKGLMTGEGKEADISKLQELCNANGMNIRALTEEQAVNLIEILRDYKEVIEVNAEDVQVEDDPITEVVQSPVVEDDPF